MSKTGPLVRSAKTGPLRHTAKTGPLSAPSKTGNLTLPATGAQKAGLSARDRRLILGFLFFAEVVFCYMVLLDPAMSKLGKLNRELDSVRANHGTLQEALIAKQVQAKKAATAQALPPFMKLSLYESPSIVLQTYLGQQVRESRATLTAVRITPQPVSLPTLQSYNAFIEVRGSFEAVSGFIRGLETPDYVIGLDKLTIELSDPERGLLTAHLSLNCFFKN